MNTYKPSAEQQAIFDWVSTGQGNAVVEAVAGAGKTTTLIKSVELMQGNVFVGAYNKKMGDELSSKTAHITNCVAKTFHSAGFGALRFYLKGKNKVAEIVGDKVKVLAERKTQSTAFDEFVPAISTLVSLAKQSGFFVRGVCPEPMTNDWMNIIDHYNVEDQLPEWGHPNDLVRLANEILQQSNAVHHVIDFDDMIYLPLFLNLRFFKNDWVLIDEAQDTNATRLEMARRMLKTSGRLIAVGDPHQAIFGFTGADANSINSIRDAFNAITLQMSVTFRCPKVVVREAQTYVKHIVSHPNSPDGDHFQMTMNEMIKFVEAGDAIIARYNRALVETCFKLIREGIPAKIEGKSIGEGLIKLISRWKVKTLDGLKSKLIAWKEKEISKIKAKANWSGDGMDVKIEYIQDQYSTINVLIDRSREEGINTVDGLKMMIKNMFDDIGNTKKFVVLSSVHRSKGLEWDRVFILDRLNTMPSKRATQEWQRKQEINLIYVALTRAKTTLIDIIRDEEKDEQAGRKQEQMGDNGETPE